MKNITKFLNTIDISKFDESFIKSYNEESDEEYFFEVDVLFPGKLHDLHNDLLFLAERMKIEKVEKLAANLHERPNMLYT